MIKNYNEFTKLFKINIPVQEHAEYYLSTLIKSKEYSNLPNQIKLFEDYEDFIEKSEFTSLGNYKFDLASPTLIKFIENTKAYKVIQEMSIDFQFVKEKDEYFVLRLQRVSDIHLFSHLKYENSQNVNIQTLLIVVVASLTVLLIIVGFQVMMVIIDLRRAIKRLNSILEDSILGGGLIRPEKLTSVLEILHKGKKIETHGG